SPAVSARPDPGTVVQSIGAAAAPEVSLPPAVFTAISTPETEPVTTESMSRTAERFVTSAPSHQRESVSPAAGASGRSISTAALPADTDEEVDPDPIVSFGESS